jgi:hypothetical protein
VLFAGPPVYGRCAGKGGMLFGRTHSLRMLSRGDEGVKGQKLPQGLSREERGLAGLGPFEGLGLPYFDCCTLGDGEERGPEGVIEAAVDLAECFHSRGAGGVAGLVERGRAWFGEVPEGGAEGVVERTSQAASACSPAQRT